MLLQIKHYGQLCNRLFSLIPTMAYAIHEKVKLYVLFEDKQYLDYFPSISKSPWVKFLYSKDVEGYSSLFRMTKWLSNDPKKNIGAKVERAFLRMADRPGCAVNGDLREIGRWKGLVCVDGWEHRYDLSFIDEERDKLLGLFKPREDIVRHVNKIFENYNGITVGVHVRRGDYKEHLGGKYYYDDETYLDAIRIIKNELTHRGGNSRFFICSNEPFFMRNDVAEMFQIEPLFPSDCMSDLYGLSKCDYIMGPPSTFSQWASFIGNKPLFVFFGKGHEIRLSDFSPIVRLDVFANNKGYYDRL